MPGEFLIVGFTRPEVVSQPEEEGKTISEFLEDGCIDLFHLRKPQGAQEDYLRLIETIPQHLHSKLRLHDHFELTKTYELAGVHINSRHLQAPDGVEATKSIHSLEELSHCDCYDYVTLSPIYDSISKPGYLSAFRLTELKKHLFGKRVVALGGVEPECFGELQASGFIGAAMLGALWGDKGEVSRRIREALRNLNSL